jgi:alkanesulfonate monooxygenase
MTMTLCANANAMGGHVGEWRHPLAWDAPCMNLDNAIAYAQIAERGLFDLLFLADGNGVRQMDKPDLFAPNSPSDRPAVFEPVTLLTAIAMATQHIGLVATATTTYEEPFTLARKFGSLDHISKGRAGWNLVTTSNPDDALNFSASHHMERETRYERAIEFAEVVKGLWDSWADDAFIQDKAARRYLDPAKVHVLNHRGTHFSVAGPLNMARPPQGHPLIFSAGQSPAGLELSAKLADCVFASAASKEGGQRLYADLKGRMAKYGREPDELRIIPGLTVFVGETEAEADALFNELENLVSPAVGVDYLSKMMGLNMKGFPLDGPLPPLPEEGVGGTAIRRTIAEAAAQEGLTIRQTYQRILPQMGGNTFKGSVQQVVDQMEDWYTGGACDGFMISAPVIPHGLARFVDLVIPELQRRGLFRTAYTGRTLRENLGLPARPNRYFVA